MTKKPDFSHLGQADRISGRIAELRQGLSGADPGLLANNTAADWQSLGDSSGVFRLPLWGRSLEVAYPAWSARRVPSGEPVSPMELALLLYYFSLADGSRLAQEWISFADLPDGRFYNQAFQGYTGKELARAFQNDLATFERAAASLNGKRVALGGAAFAFYALPRVPLCAVYWPGDEDFPASAQALFDASASHYLTTDAYAILGSTLTRRLIAAAKNLALKDTDHAD